ncbi:MAG: TIGR01244 family phosphatase [Robiginitomaculum sp.]|nr:MAG: TIGR01244 family phosphatase [Robiginitomaculum sp.]
MILRPLTETFAVSPQIRPADVAAAAAQGYRAIINNRPDGESWGQPKSADIEAEAIAHGLSYTHIPVSLRGLDPEQVGQMIAAQKAAEGPVLAFCKTGTRSSILWALSQAGKMPADEIIAAAAKAGYNVSNLRAHLG